MYCPKCGAKLTKNAAFCHMCGEKLPEEISLAKDGTEADDYDALFASNDTATGKPADLLKMIISDNEDSTNDNINFSIPDDWESLNEQDSIEGTGDEEYSEDDLNFIIPENWDL